MKKAWKVLKKPAELILTGIVFAIVASMLSTWILKGYEERQEREDLLESVSNIYIGSNKLWVDEHLGAPQFSAQKGEYTLCAYISEYYVVQIAFDQSDAAQGYLITSLKNEDNVRIVIDDNTLVGESGIPSNSAIGEFSYYDFEGSPMRVSGFTSNGNERIMYWETYYYMSGGNYYEYHIASLDFGQIQGTWEQFHNQFGLYTGEEDLDDEVSSEIIKGMIIPGDRDTTIPNTYGVSNHINLEELLFSYDWFNSQQLRNRLNGNRWS